MFNMSNGNNRPNAGGNNMCDRSEREFIDLHSERAQFLIECEKLSAKKMKVQWQYLIV